MLCIACVIYTDGFFFFFSSRRRHTRWTGDWSSDVCSTDLVGHNVNFLNDRYPAATTDDGKPKTEKDWVLERTVVKRRAAIGKIGRASCRERGEVGGRAAE